MADDPTFQSLTDYLSQVPAIDKKVACGFFDDGRWWVKFAIDIGHPLAWSVVQELGHVLNYMSLDDRLPTVFMPVSPPPYMNGGPRAYLSWVIECKDKNFTAQECAEWLESRLPRPVSDATQWQSVDDEDVLRRDLG